MTLGTHRWILMMSFGEGVGLIWLYDVAYAYVYIANWILLEDDSKHNFYPLKYIESFLGVTLFHSKEEVLV